MKFHLKIMELNVPSLFLTFSPDSFHFPLFPYLFLSLSLFCFPLPFFLSHYPFFFPFFLLPSLFSFYLPFFPFTFLFSPSFFPSLFPFPFYLHLLPSPFSFPFFLFPSLFPCFLPLIIIDKLWTLGWPPSGHDHFRVNWILEKGSQTLKTYWLINYNLWWSYLISII